MRVAVMEPLVPRYLRQAERWVSRQASGTGPLDERSRRSLSQALKKLERQFRRQRVTWRRSEIEVLARGILESDAERQRPELEVLRKPEARVEIVRIAARAGVRWRILWMLWERLTGNGSTLDGAVTEQLCEALADGVSAARKRESILEWLPHQRPRLRRALDGPESLARAFCEQREIPLYEAWRPLEVSPGFGRGLGIYAHIVRKGSEDWWRCHDERQLRAWASGVPLDLQQRVVQRSLEERGRSAQRPGDLPCEDADLEMVRWVRQLLGDPLESPGHWSGVSDRAREIYEWYNVRDQFGKILRQFRLDADDRERADFWASYLRALVDARLVEGSPADTPICLMAFDDLLVVEFGKVGNACYLYDRPRTFLRSYDLHEPAKPGDFKRLHRQLAIGEERIHNRGRLPHHPSPGWEDGFEVKLEKRHGVVRPR